MEKTICLAIIIMFINLLTAKGLAAERLPSEANGLITVAQLATAQNLPIEKILLEGWLPLSNERNFKILQGQLVESAQQQPIGDSWQLSAQTSLKMYCHGGKKTVVEFQLSSTDLVEAEYYYQLFQQFSDRYAKKEPIGATIITELDEALDVKTCQYLTMDLLGDAQARLLSTTAEGRYLSYAYQVKGVSPSIEVAGEAVNLNIAYVVAPESTRLYLASPIIYQPY